MGGADRADPPGLVRDADQPAAQGRRHRGDGRDRRATRGAEGGTPAAHRRRQHVRLAGLQRPLTLGADIVFHSATKYLAGHSDTILGVAVTSDDAVAERLRFLQNAMGGVPGPLDCFLVLRGLRTLHLRMERHRRNAPARCAALPARPRRTWRDGPLPGVRRDGLVHAAPAAARPRPPRNGPSPIAEGTRLFTLAESLGGVESLIEVPAAMTHLSVAGSPLEVDPALIRLSVGIEGVDDLIADLTTGARRGLTGAARPGIDPLMLHPMTPSTERTLRDRAGSAAVRCTSGHPRPTDRRSAPPRCKAPAMTGSAVASDALARTRADGDRGTRWISRRAARVGIVSAAQRDRRAACRSGRRRRRGRRRPAAATPCADRRRPAMIVTHVEDLGGGRPSVIDRAVILGR